MAACCGNDGVGLHACLVEVLEGLAGDRGAEQVDRLAYHALRAEVWAKAVPYCQQAECQGARPWAPRAAVGAFEQAPPGPRAPAWSRTTPGCWPSISASRWEARCTPGRVRAASHRVGRGGGPGPGA